ncbi:hypothetical protein [Rhodoferax sp. PAMC 29310]|uniref:hypothetical protein n=1 Tax=Rhodoferax sp. PAMC 29310 TaxID=2822760 RepID=UPI001B33AF35|nr:hypothetical protein [Rhodoferax sp. PAMC 29310]
MTDQTLDLTAAIFAKTSLGQQEIQSRSLGLSVLVRRILVLIDGKRNGVELGGFVQGHDISAIISELMGHGCIDATAPAPHAAEPEAVAPKAKKPDGTSVSSLPPHETRTAKDLEMARNFMTNSVNNMFGQHTRLTLIEAIFKCDSSAALREVYPAWVETMSGSAIGTRRLPELQQKTILRPLSLSTPSDLAGSAVAARLDQAGVGIVG